MTPRVFSTAEDPEYVLEPLREDADFTLYRGTKRGNAMPILVTLPAAEQPPPQILQRLEHEYSLANELDAAWAAQPLALTRHQGHAILILKDPGGEPLDRVIEQHQLQDLSRLLPIAIGLASALGQVHRQGLIHKDVKPANALVDDDRTRVAHRLRHRLPTAARAPSARAAGNHCRHACLYVPGTDRADESIDRYPQRSLLFGRHLVSDADGRAPVCCRRPSWSGSTATSRVSR